MTTHKVKLVVTTEKKLEPNPNPCTLPIFVGDSINFYSDQGAIEIQFEPGHPFAADTFKQPEPGLTDNAIRVERAAVFVGQCAMTLPSGERMVWDRQGGVTGQTKPPKST